MRERLVFGYNLIVAPGEGRGSESDWGEETEERVHGRKCVDKAYPTHALW